MKMVFHDNALSVRGTSVALFDYAFFARKIYNIEPFILYNNTLPVNSQEAINKFTKHFTVYSYNHPSQIDNILESIGAKLFFIIKGGARDGIISQKCKNLISAISGQTSIADVHGDKWAYASKWLSLHCSGGQVPVVPYMVSLPSVEENLRRELGIPESATVFGRNGGYETFDIDWARDAVREAVSQREDIYFLFQFTEKFIDHPRVLHLNENADLDYKVKFINSCDAMIHARVIGESFGLSCAEFSLRNKPVITWNGSAERNHIMQLAEKGIYYSNKEELKHILLSYDKGYYANLDNNCYKEFSPENVMKTFYNYYISDYI